MYSTQSWGRFLRAMKFALHYDGVLKESNVYAKPRQDEVAGTNARTQPLSDGKIQMLLYVSCAAINERSNGLRQRSEQNLMRNHYR